MRVRALASWVLAWLCALLGVLSLWGASALASGGGFALPDGRGWELVSPVDKHGAAIEGITYEFAVAQAAVEGDGFAYTANGAVTGDAAGNDAPQFSQMLSRRGSGGWSSQDIATPHEAIGELFDPRTEYRLFSPDLSVGLVEPRGNTPLPPLAAGAEKTIYLRDDATGSYLPLVTAANVLPGSKFGGEITFQGASPDLSHVVFSSPEALTADAVTVTVQGGTRLRSLYEWAGGQLRLVSVLPDGKPAVEGAGENSRLGFEGNIVRHAVSDDGSRVIWEADNEGSGYDQHHLYLRDVARGETVQVDLGIQEGAGSHGEKLPVFQAASRDGSRVFFTDGSPQIGELDLYVWEASVAGGRLSGTVKDLTVAVNAGEKTLVQGTLLGASEDGSTVYFVANGVLAPGATPGNCSGNTPERVCNVYVLHRDGGGWGKPRFVAAVSGDDQHDWGNTTLVLAELMTSRVSPDGRFLVFMSDQGLTGYDNRDAVSGVPDEEVYRFDDATGRLVCVSCDPSGARPAGILDTERIGLQSLLVDQAKMWKNRWLAGSVPGWTPTTNRGYTALYQSRYLSDDGRVFFMSPVALVPGDVNGREDVYEFEPVGVGGCQSTTASLSVVFSAASEGCVGLVSSGTSGDESAFLDASASGGDVFFLSSARLSPLDVDGAFDVYDAHECTSSSPCPAPVVSSPACGSAESCRGSLPGPAAFAVPGSAMFTGAGNAPPVVSGPVVGRRVLSRAQKLARALRACRGKPRGRRRVCEARARRAFRASQSTARNASSARAGR